MLAYPSRVAFSLLNKLIDEYFNANRNLASGVLTSYLQKYQNPAEADSIMKVQKELDETKIILVRGFSRCT